MICTELQTEVPDTFPDVQFGALFARSRGLLAAGPNPLWREHALAMNAVGYRYRGCSEEVAAFVASWERAGPTAGFEELYLRERALFGFLASAASCLHVTAYAVHALAAHATTLALPFSDREQRNCSVRTLRDLLQQTHPVHPLTLALRTVTDDPCHQRLFDLRNRLTHRGAIPRISYASLGGPPPAPAMPFQYDKTPTTSEIHADIDYLHDHFMWLTRAVGDVMNEASRL